MALALRLGARGLGQVWPNPAVGCVIVRDGRIVGRGWTQPGGRPHAETVALAQAGEAARGATAYVTLEPCAHHGRTPPCCDALIDAGLARVVVALRDPDPRVDGEGLRRLRAAGITVDPGVMEAEARVAQAGFLSAKTRGRPFVTLKLASSLDGRIAMASGESRWITGAQARRAVHALRMRHDAVMVGAGTARADDPELTVRDMGAPAQPVRIVLDSRLSHAPDSRLGRSAKDAPVWVCHGADAPQGAQQAWLARGARLIACAAASGGGLELGAVMRELAGAGLTRVLCEGGAQLAAALIAEGLVDELVQYVAGVAIGADGRAMTGALGPGQLADAARFELVAVERIGGDAMLRWRSASS
ncbi:MAG: bifunctional diaminohydroxyphosphoribosylaminopyrimidine deaminase/5-amino-6-(5-phosphoribosylamino)uracil reductase RibD [Paracoccaceae bacterium]